MRAIKLGSKRKLKPADARRFEHLEPSLFADLATVVCSTGALPQKELHECWQMANHVHAEFPATPRVADIAAGHGLLGWILVLLARTGPDPVPRTAVAVDVARPKSAALLAAAMTERWPQLAGAVHYVEGSVDALTSGDGPGTLFVAAHACGSLSDRVLLAAMRSGSPVAIMPCCHTLRKQARSLSELAVASGLAADATACLTPSSAELGQPASIDRFRIDALVACGYEIRAASIDPEITTFNRIIMGHPLRPVASPAVTLPAPSVATRHQGRTRAHATVSSLDVANHTHAAVLSQRPSTEWLRSFDLSFWVHDDATGHHLGAVIDRLAARALPTAQRAISIRDRYADPKTARLAFTFRVELRSLTELAKDDAMLLRSKLCRTLERLGPRCPRAFELRAGKGAR
jgi:hypothetical protein